MAAKRDKQYEVFQQLRLEEFAALWAEFAATRLDVQNEDANQVINGLPIEALNDWKRDRDRDRT